MPSVGHSSRTPRPVGPVIRWAVAASSKGTSRNRAQGWQRRMVDDVYRRAWANAWGSVCLQQEGESPFIAYKSELQSTRVLNAFQIPTSTPEPLKAAVSCPAIAG